MQFKKVESRIKPQEIEKCYTEGYYLRKNITEDKRINDKGEEYIMYIYDEAIVSEVGYIAYSITKQLKE